MTKIRAKWLETSIVRKVVSALGAENVRFVGGAVRDTLIDRPVNDIDAATRHRPEVCKMLLEAAGVKVVPTGLKHGTVTAIWGADVMEITTLRVDVDTDGRHADVVFTEDWLEDAKRRDFTFNALYAAADGTLYDPFGGLDDLKTGRVRFIGDAGERIEEDALRILRFFRFYARYGSGSADAEALAACAEKVALLDVLSIERVRDELLKLLAVADPMPTLLLMMQSNVLPRLFGQRISLEKLSEYMEKADQHIYPLYRLFFLLRQCFTSREVGCTLKLANAETESLVKLEAALGWHDFTTDKAIRLAVYRFGNEASFIAAHMAQPIEADAALIRIAEKWRAPYFPVQGRDLIDQGMAPGREMGLVLKHLEQVWVDSDFTLNKAQLLESL